MNIRAFTSIVSAGIDADIKLAPNGKDFVMRARSIPDLKLLVANSTRLGILEISLEPGQYDEERAEPGVIVTFKNAAHAIAPDFSILSAREQQVMELLAVGKRNADIAEELGIGIKTVDTHRQHLIKKLGVRNNSELTRLAVRSGLIQA